MVIFILIKYSIKGETMTKIFKALLFKQTPNKKWTRYVVLVAAENSEDAENKFISLYSENDVFKESVLKFIETDLTASEYIDFFETYKIQRGIHDKDMKEFIRALKSDNIDPPYRKIE